MKTLKTLAVIGFLAILGAIAAAVFFFGGFYNVAASVEDPAIVNWALVHIRRASIARHATDTPPLSLDDAAVVQEGARAFSERGCVNCHGAPGVNWAKFSEGLRPDPPDLRFFLRDLDRVPDLFVEQRARQRRDVRERPARGVGLVLADDPESLAAPVVADDGHGRAEMHLAPVAGRRGELCRRPPRGPVAQVASRARQRGAVVPGLGGGVVLLQARDFGLDVREPLGGHQVGVRRNRPLRQLFGRVLQLFDECSTHEEFFRYCDLARRADRFIIWDVDGQRGTLKADLDAPQRAAVSSGTISLGKSSLLLGAFGRMRCTARRSLLLSY